MTTNPFSTGGGGSTFELKAAAIVLKRLLLGEQLHPVGRVTRVRFQQRVAGHRFDDLLVESTPSAGPAFVLEAQIRHRPILGPSDAGFVSLIRLAHESLASSPDAYRQGYRRLALIVDRDTPGSRDFADLCERAAARTNAQEFVRSLEVTSYTRKSMRTRSALVREAVGRALGRPCTNEEYWQLLAAISIYRWELDGERAPGLVSAVNEAVRALSSHSFDRADALMTKLLAIAADLNSLGGDVDRSGLLQRLGPDLRRDLESSSSFVLREAKDSLHYGFPSVPSRPELIGREAERRLLARRLRSRESRLISIVGPPGIGKSALALSVAHLEAKRMPGRQHLVDLRGIDARGSDSAQRILDRIGTSLVMSQVSSESVTMYLQSAGSFLLVLDNFEHLLTTRNRKRSVEVVDELLRRTHGLRVIVTSRSELDMAAAFALRLQPLGLPQFVEGISLPTMLRAPAVRLFVRQARRADRRFDPSIVDSCSLQEITKALDGVPLAIELAASRLAVLPLEELVTFYRGTGPVRTPRDRLRLEVRRSLRLIPAAGRRAIQALALFPTSFSRFDALDALRATGFDEASSHAHLEALTAASLLDRDTPLRRNSAFRVLEPIRRELWNMIRSRSKREELVCGYLRYLVSTAEQSELDMRGSDQVAAFDRCAQLMPAAVEGLRLASDVESATRDGVRLVTALAFYWWIRGPSHQAVEWLGWALQRSGRRSQHALLLAHLGRFAWTAGDSSGGHNLLRKAASRAASRGQRWAHVRISAMWASMLAHDGDLEQARSLAQNAEQQSALLEDKWLLAICSNLRGEVERLSGQDGSRHYKTSLELSQMIDDTQGCCLVEYNMGWLRLSDQLAHEAATHFKASLELAIQVRDWRRIAGSIEGIVSAGARIGLSTDGPLLLGAASGMRMNSGVPGLHHWDTALVSSSVGPLRARSGDGVFDREFARGGETPPIEAYEVARSLADAVIQDGGPESRR